MAIVEFKYKIGSGLAADVQSKANYAGWDVAHLGRRLIDLWMAGAIRAGKPGPGRRQARYITSGFRLDAAIKIAFQAKAAEAGWNMSQLIVRLFNYWLSGFIDAGAPMNAHAERKNIIQDGQAVECYTLKQASFVLGVAPLTLRKRLSLDKKQGGIFKITPADLDTIEQKFFPKLNST